MRRLLNTLFVTTQGAYLYKDGETVAIRVERKTRMRLPMHTLEGIICFGRISCSPYLLGACAQKKIGISYMSENGRFLARIQGAVSGNVLLRREQYRRADDEQSSSAISFALLAGKLTNSRTVLLRALRDHRHQVDSDVLESAAQHISALRKELNPHKPLDILRGIEGDAASAYFNVFDHLIIKNKDVFQFKTRNRRPPLDSVNCLLSFVYTLVLHDVQSALECVGLDPAVGFLHRDRPGRPGLALDLMEEFRSFMADRLVLSLINLGQIPANGFRYLENGAVLLGDDARKRVLIAYQKRKQSEIMHPFLGEKMPVGLLPYTQALLLARHLRGDLDGYPPFVWR
ncbi:MAG: type I-C CRISPR-associated endonuclease Cas1 [Deltaproteobacteria bacterium]|nr:type I-C CRISPR-associated endonuclease Cas1 [Deltaproteobacteria bacterium]